MFIEVIKTFIKLIFLAQVSLPNVFIYLKYILCKLVGFCSAGHICDLLSENLTYLHFSLILFYDIFVVRRKKTNGLLNFQPFLVSSFGVLVIDNQKSKTIDLYSAYTEKFYRRSFNRS